MNLLGISSRRNANYWGRFSSVSPRPNAFFFFCVSSRPDAHFCCKKSTLLCFWLFFGAFWLILAVQICRPYSVFGTRDIVFTKNIEKTKVFQWFWRIGWWWGPLGVLGRPLGVLWVSWVCLWSAWGAFTVWLEGLDGTFFWKISLIYHHIKMYIFLLDIISGRSDSTNV